MLDLFCGTGALAIEAISRGADPAMLVDRDAGARAAQRRASSGSRDRCEVVRADALALPAAHATARFDLVFCDPPYRLADRLEPELDTLSQPASPRTGASIVESSARRPLELDLPARARRRAAATATPLIRIHRGGER